MKFIKLLGIVLASYVLLVAIITATIGYVQPTMPGEVVLTTYDEQGDGAQRTLAGVRMDERVYVSANQWSRAWYSRALANPAVRATVDGHAGAYTAVAVTGAELVRIAEVYQMDFVLRFVTGFAPRRFMRLEPAVAQQHQARITIRP